MIYYFAWDEEKAEANLKKHKVSFREAETVFSDPFSITIDDPLHSQGEARFICVGYSNSQRLLIVVHTFRGNTIRIISARIATKQERKNYEQGN